MTPSAPQPARNTILVVDDEPSVLTLIEQMLESTDYIVVPANCAPAALTAVEKCRLQIDLLLTDIVMPDMSGRDLAERMLWICPQMRVLFMSGVVDSSTVRLKVFNRAMGFLPKPFTSDELHEKIRQTLGAPMYQSAAVGADTFTFWHALTRARH